MPFHGEAIKEAFEDLKRIEPDLVLTHTRDDLHQDHRLACELTWNTFRDHLILEYEVPKWDGDLGRPNVYVPLEDDLVARKLDLVLATFRLRQGSTGTTPRRSEDSCVSAGWVRLAVQVCRGVLRSQGRALAVKDSHANSRNR